MWVSSGVKVLVDAKYGNSYYNENLEQRRLLVKRY